MMRKAIVLIISIASSFLAGAIGSLATIPNIPTWYASLQKPPLLPPNWVFGPVWTILYFLMAISVYLVWLAPSKRNKCRAYSLFAAQLAFNALWSITFFGLHLPLLSLAVITALLALIIWTIYEFTRFSRAAAYLLVPYAVWVGFATYLTAGVTWLN